MQIIDIPAEFQLSTEWTVLTRLQVDGVPKAQPRQRYCIRQSRDGRRFAAGYAPPVADDWKARIIQVASENLPESPLSGPVRVDWVLLMPRPQNLYRKKDPEGPLHCFAKPDRDNLDKAILDCLKQIRFFGDDCQVCAGSLEKYYHGKSGRPGALITISVPAEDPQSAEPGDLFA